MFNLRILTQVIPMAGLFFLPHGAARADALDDIAKAGVIKVAVP